MKRIVFTFLFLTSIILHLSSTKVLSNSIYIRFKPNLDKNIIKEILELGYFVTFEQILPDSLSLIKKIEKGEQLLSFNNEKLEKILRAEEPLLRTYECKLKENIDLLKFCNFLQKKFKEIEIAEPIYKDEILEIPNDPYATNQTMLSTINAFSTWDTVKGDTNIIIGIVDTGVLQNHEDLSASIAPNWKEIPDNNIDDDKNGFVDDYLGCNLAYGTEGNGGNTYHSSPHGTAVAGIAGATTNNAKGIAGVAYKCRIFPIKASKLTNTTTIDYSYRGILYSAIRGCKVVNCSWGKKDKPPSPIEQSIIDYAVARDVVVVAAGGNGNNSNALYYPAAYNGVLGVGEVNQLDYVTPTTSINESIRIMAPGINNYITLNTPNGYEISREGGTSYSAPVVSGVTAIVRSLYPKLDPLQTIEYVRQLSDDISEKNPSCPNVIPGRINMKKMLEIHPFSIPGIKPLNVSFYHTDGTKDDRFFVGDTVIVKIDAFNYLGSAKNLRFNLSIADIFDSSLEIINAEQFIEFVDKESKLLVGPFSFKILQKNESPTLLRVDITGENSYKDFFLFRFLPTSYIATFENDSIKFSISDKGTLGFYRTSSFQFGEGVASKTLGNQLFKGGLMVTEDSSKLVTALFGLAPDKSDFRIIKPFANPNKNISIIDDSLAQPFNRIGVEIQQFVYLPPFGQNFFKIFFKIKNISGRTLKNLSIGYYNDWDVGLSANNNISYLEPNAIPRTILPIAAAVQFIQSTDSTVFVGVGVHSDKSSDLPQSAVLNSEFTSALTKDKLILSLNSGLKLQYKGEDDLAVVSGMKFPGELKPGEERNFAMMIAISNRRETLIQIFLENLLQSKVENSNQSETFNIYPNPSFDKIILEFVNFDFLPLSFQIINNLGQVVKSGNLLTNVIDISELQSGIYLLRIEHKGTYFTQKFIKIN
ncbi:MAG: S8 family peptidase [Ignavibacteria bacterium]|nr:S8 family peptidase [Ignavibacteria bacterium]